MNMQNNRPTRHVRQSYFNVCVRGQIFYLTVCIIYHIITFDCQEQFTPAVKCKLCGWVSRRLPPAVQFLLELALLDAVYAFSSQLPISSYRNIHLESSATHSVFYINYGQLPK